MSEPPPEPCGERGHLVGVEAVDDLGDTVPADAVDQLRGLLDRLAAAVRAR